MTINKDKIVRYSQFRIVLESFIQKCTNQEKRTDEEQTFYTIIQQAHLKNGWFSEKSVINSLKGIALMLDEKNVSKWLDQYDLDKINSKRVGLILAGNIPFVGWQDIFCVLMSGHQACVKLSSKDAGLTKALIEFLSKDIPEIKEQIHFVDRIKDIDVVIATGSNNSQRYFEQYFGNMPHIFRKNRNAVAVLTGNETESELMRLADDIMLYYGLGCRNVSKLYLPEGFDLNKIFKAVYEKYSDFVNHNKYMNNFDYQRSIFMMSQHVILENGLLILKEDERLASPISVCYYEYYSNIEELKTQLQEQKDAIQCFVSQDKSIETALPLGKSQYPEINDYADGVDTMSFLIKLHE